MICILRRIASMTAGERRRLALRTSDAYASRLCEFYRSRERYSDVTFKTEEAMKRIWPILNALVQAWAEHTAFIARGGLSAARKWDIPTVLEPDPEARLWVEWSNNTLQHTSLMDVIREDSEIYPLDQDQDSN